MGPSNDKELHDRVERQVRRMRQAERERTTLMAQTVYLGTLGLVFVLPVIGGAYLGSWLDGMVEGYSMRWTLSLIVTGLVVGAINVWLLIRD
ncbi:MAG: AtpZ/AtpI family protein [Chromatiaceae bacterium]|jgi:ATP synthase protein I